MSRPAVIFDLDGTLIDSVPAIHTVTNQVLSEQGFAPVTLMQVRGFVGRGVAHLVACVMQEAGLPPEGPLFDDLQARFIERYAIEVEGNTPSPNVLSALKALRDDGHKLGVCTNKPMEPTRAALAHVGLLNFFEVIVAGDTLAVRKPDPEPLHHAIALIGGGPVVYVGDSEIDAETAAAAEQPFLLFTEGYRKTPVHELPHDAVFSDFAMLPGLVSHYKSG